MGLFSRNFDRPGPGVPKDMPRKKGVARFFEILFRDMADFVKLSVLFCLALLPSAAVFILGAFPLIFGAYEINILYILISLLLAYPVGGALVACYFNITRFMRDEPSYLWFDFKRKFKENVRQAALAGIICTAFVYMQILLWFQVYYQAVEGVYTGGLGWLLMALLSLVLFSMITPYIFLHYAYIDLNSLMIVRNSFLIAFAHLPRSFMGAICGGIIWVLFVIFFPGSMIAAPFVPLILASLSMFLFMSWIWPPFDKHFNIEETLKKRKDEENESEGNAPLEEDAD